MFRITGAFLALIFLAGLMEPLAARPEFLNRFKSDPFRRAEVDGCAVCHDNPKGGGPRNEFGSAFDAAGRLITPLIRANFPDRFEVETLRLADGSVFYFSDPENKFVVFKRAEKKFLIDLAAVAAKTEDDKIPLPENRMGFFITSKGLNNGGHLGGLAGADRHCQSLADAAGAGDRTWRAYLSTSYLGEPAINAGDRIGNGPWYNAKGKLIARGVVDLHEGSRLNTEMALNEKGEVVNGFGQEPNQHDILTGSLPNGKAAAGMNCNNWTSSNEGKAMVGHHDRQGDSDSKGSWNSAHPTSGCSQESFKATGGEGFFYCFAVH